MSYIMALDQGTTSSRALIFDSCGRMVGLAQKEHRQVLPAPGWLEQDPEEIWTNICWAVDAVLAQAGLKVQDLACVGITNQRETTVVWSVETGEPVYNAIVWQDLRTQSRLDRLKPGLDLLWLKRTTGLFLSAYFSASKLAWILDKVPRAREQARQGRLRFGTIDSWLIWRLTGRHLTDLTNASRTLLFDINTLSWSDQLLDIFGLPKSLLPQVVGSVGEIAVCGADTPLAGLPITAVLGDQQAALFGHRAFAPGQAKATFGTGAFVMYNTGDELVYSADELLTTLAYALPGSNPQYALEGSVGVAGSLVQWLRDNLGLIDSSAEVEALALGVEDNGGVYFVPAFSGLYAPYWRSDARGVIAGLTRFANRGHLARASLEAAAYATRDVLEAVSRAVGGGFDELRVDGAMVANGLFVQFLADILPARVCRLDFRETTALGAAYAAGVGAGIWDLAVLKTLDQPGEVFRSSMKSWRRDFYYSQWKKAIARSFGWA